MENLPNKSALSHNKQTNYELDWSLRPIELNPFQLVH